MLNLATLAVYDRWPLRQVKKKEKKTNDPCPPPPPRAEKMEPQAKDVDTKAAKRTRDKATAAPTSGVGLIQSFFFSKKPAPTPPPPAPATAPAPASTKGGGSSSSGSGNARNNGDAAVGRGMGARGVPPPVPPRSGRFSNGIGGGGAGAGVGAGGRAEGEEVDGCSEELNTLIEGAVPEEFAGKSWEGYLHHVDFIVALMHVGTSLIPKSLIKVNALVYWLSVGQWIGR